MCVSVQVFVVGGSIGSASTASAIQLMAYAKKCANAHSICYYKGIRRTSFIRFVCRRLSLLVLQSNSIYSTVLRTVPITPCDLFTLVIHDDDGDYPPKKI